MSNIDSTAKDMGKDDLGALSTDHPRHGEGSDASPAALTCDAGASTAVASIATLAKEALGTISVDPLECDDDVYGSHMLTVKNTFLELAAKSDGGCASHAGSAPARFDIYSDVGDEDLVQKESRDVDAGTGAVALASGKGSGSLDDDFAWAMWRASPHQRRRMCERLGVSFKGWLSWDWPVVKKMVDLCLATGMDAEATIEQLENDTSP